MATHDGPALSPEALACGAEWAAYLRAVAPGYRGTAASGLATAASVIDQAAGASWWDDGTELWGKREVAAFLGIALSSVNDWVRTRKVPVAERVVVSGRLTNRYRPADVRAAAESAPGKGNRTPRKPAETAGEPPEPPKGINPARPTRKARS